MQESGVVSKRGLIAWVPLLVLGFLAVLLIGFILGVARGLSAASAVLPAPIWTPTPEFKVERSGFVSATAPVQLPLWPPDALGKQPLQALSIQLDSPATGTGMVGLNLRFSDGSRTQVPFSAAEVVDNDYVTFPMYGKLPEQAELVSLGGSGVGTYLVTDPGGFTAACAVYDLMDGTQVRTPGCS